ncbi:hypothetical protein ACFPFP_36865 [Bradyrhizobium sp. GCM10023182]|uniref:Uncharacterized protein n=1 Tax=Bradyrhizobium zhengyangense TaxID=2911009 RepID=A0ABS9M045_9BRAD|nr:hypothetical protein [Bradyrhizobium zhengyangense]MCG2672506.1 hypothetical protein [Bradyrhizobium zhengyangense]
MRTHTIFDIRSHWQDQDQKFVDIVFGENSNTIAARSLQDALRKLDISGTLYLGYPVLSTADAKVFVDALLVSRSHGLIAFDLSSHVEPHPSDEQIADITERQNQICLLIFRKVLLR